MKPPEQVRREIVEQWLAKADEDLGVAQHLLATNTSYFPTIGFHAQQAAEKFLKAFLVLCQVEFRKTHDLGELLDLVAGIDTPLADSLQQTTALNPYSVAFRYPGDAPHVSLEDVQHAVNLATAVRGSIVAAIEGRL